MHDIVFMILEYFFSHFTCTVENTVDLVLVFGEGVSKPCIKLLVLAEEEGRAFLLDKMIGDEGEDGSVVFVGVPLRSS